MSLLHRLTSRALNCSRLSASSSRLRSLQSLQRMQGCVCLYSKQAEETNEPVKFSTSEAALKESKFIQKHKSRAAWFEPYVIMGSIGTFLIYFCYLREENDFDEELKVSLFDRLPMLEKKQLEASIEFNELHGKDASMLQDRLDEITAKN